MEGDEPARLHISSSSSRRAAGLPPPGVAVGSCSRAFDGAGTDGLLVDFVTEVMLFPSKALCLFVLSRLIAPSTSAHARSEIEQIDSVVRSLDQLRESTGTSKTDLARRIGRNPSSTRRLFTAASNPELRLVVQIANDLDADVIVVPRRKKRDRRRQNDERASATRCLTGPPNPRLISLVFALTDCPCFPRRWRPDKSRRCSLTGVARSKFQNKLERYWNNSTAPRPGPPTKKPPRRGPFPSIAGAGFEPASFGL